jgi:hypothetical protein
MTGETSFVQVNYTHLSQLPALSDCYIVLILDPKKGQKVDITEVSVLHSEWLVGIPLTGTGPLKQTVTINVRPKNYINFDENAYCFHEWCYSTLVWKLGGCSNSLLYKLVKCVDDASHWSGGKTDEDEFQADASLQNLIASRNPTFPKLQPLFLSRLPLELRSLIWRYVSTTAAYSAFILIAGEMAELARHILSGTPTSYDLYLKEGLRLSATMVSVFGKEFIQSISADGSPEAGVEIPGGMIEINFVRSFGGICALRFVGIYGETIGESRWLGKIPTAGCNWHGEMNVENGDNGSIDRLRLIYNVSQHISRTVLLTNIE